MHCILDPKCVDHHEAVHHMNEIALKKSRESKATLRYALHLALKSNAYMWNLYQEYMKHGADTVDLLPQVDIKLKMLQAQGRMQLQDLAEIVESIPDFVGKCRAGVYEDLEEATVQYLKKVVNEMIGDQAQKVAGASEKERLSSLREILQTAMTSLPSALAFWSEALLKLQNAEQRIAMALSMGKFEVLATQCGTEKVGEEQIKDMLEASRVLIATTTEVSLEVEASVKTVVQSLVRHLSYCGTSGEAEMAMEVLRAIRNSSLLEACVGEENRKRIAAIDAWPVLEALMEKLAKKPDASGSGTTLVVDKADADIKALLAHKKTLEDCGVS